MRKKDISDAETLPENPKQINLTKMIVASGRYFDLEHPEQTPPDVHDIAFALARINRFTGARAYTVAEHSLHVSSLLWSSYQAAGQDPYRGALLGLLHDAHEAYTGDISRPVQRALPVQAMIAIQALRNRVQDEIWNVLRIPPPRPHEWEKIHKADNQALEMERRHFWPDDSADWGLPEVPELIAMLHPLTTHAHPELAWLARLQQLRGRA